MHLASLEAQGIDLTTRPLGALSSQEEEGICRLEAQPVGQGTRQRRRRAPAELRAVELAEEGLAVEALGSALGRRTLGEVRPTCEEQQLPQSPRRCRRHAEAVVGRVAKAAR